MISFDKLIHSLDVLGVSLEEYELLLNDNCTTDSKYFIQEIDQAIIGQDKDKLLDLIGQAEKDGFPYISLSARASIDLVNELELEKITDYFFSLEIWLPSDLWMLSLTVSKLEVHDTLHLIDYLLQNNRKLVNSNRHRDYFVRALCEASYHLTVLGYKNYSRHILNYLEQWQFLDFSLPDSLFLQTLYNLTLDFWIIHFQNYIAGKVQIDKYLKIIDDLGLQELANYFTVRYSIKITQYE